MEAIKSLNEKLNEFGPSINTSEIVYVIKNHLHELTEHH